MKKASLSTILSAANATPRPHPAGVVSPVVLGAKAPGTARYRVGRIHVAGYFDPAVRASLRLVQAQKPGLSVQGMLAEALNDLFAKYNVPQTAAVDQRDSDS